MGSSSLQSPVGASRYPGKPKRGGSACHYSENPGAGGCCIVAACGIEAQDDMKTAEFKAVLPPPSEAERLEGEAAAIIQGASGKSLAERLDAAELAAELQRRATALRKANAKLV